MRAIARRMISVGGVTVGLLLVVGLFPLLLVLAGAADLPAIGRWPRVRMLLALLWVLVHECIGVGVAGWLWLKHTGNRKGEEWLASHYALQRWWAGQMFWGVVRLYRISVSVEGEDCFTGDPLLLMVRHASTADTLIPAAIVSHRHRYRLRYVVKQELRWDPCLDIVGSRLPNHFVNRDGGEPLREIEAIQALAQDLEHHEGVLIFPEGTRFTPGRREKALKRLQEAGDPTRFQAASAMKHVLPPRPGGPVGLIQAAPHADVVFCAHAGFEGATRFSDLWKGRLLDSRVRILFWRETAVPREDREEILRWLYQQWERVNEFVIRNQASDRK